MPPLYRVKGFVYFHLRRFSLSFPVEDLFESVNDREIRQVFEGQTQIHLEIKQLHRQLAMILDEQRRYVALITEEVSKKGTAVESGQVRAVVAAGGRIQTGCLSFHLLCPFLSSSLQLDAAGQQQLGSVLSNQQEVLRSLSELR